MTERRLNQVNRRPTVERMGSVGMPQPVGRNGDPDARARRGCPNDSQYRERLKEAAVLCGLAGAEDRGVGSGILRLQTFE